MATNLCSNIAPSNEVAKQGLTDMYLPTLKLREARSPTYWAIVESNHQSNINLLPKPSPREYRPKAVDYNSPFGSGPYISRPAASGVVSLVPLQSLGNSTAPLCMSSAEIPNISINAADSLEVNCNDCPQGIPRDILCCTNARGDRQQYPYDKKLSKDGYSPTTNEQSEKMPTVEIGEAPGSRGFAGSENLSGLCCPGMFGNPNDDPGAATKNLLDAVPASQNISYDRPSREYTTQGGQDGANATHGGTAGNRLDGRQRPPTSETVKISSGKPSKESADYLDYDTSVNDVSSPRSESHPTYMPQAPSNQQNRPQVPQSRPSSGWRPPNASDGQPSRAWSTQPGAPRDVLENKTTETQKTVEPFVPPPTHGPSTTSWDAMNDRRGPLNDQMPNYWNQDGRNNDPNHPSQGDWLRETVPSQNRSVLGLCGGPAETDEQDQNWPDTLGEYESPDGVVGSTHMGPASRAYQPLCGSYNQQPNTSTWALETPDQIEALRGAARNESKVQFPDQNGPIVETGAVDSHTTVRCCEAEFVKTDIAERRVSEPTNRIIQALSPRGLCGGPPANRLFPHIQHYDVVQ